MEKLEAQFAVMPQSISLNDVEDSFKVHVKNTSCRTCHYQVFVPSSAHFKIIGDRTFSLAPGMSKSVRVRHLKASHCSAWGQVIEVVDTFGNRKDVEVVCAQEKEEVEVNRVEMEHEISLSNMKIGEQKLVEVPIVNTGLVNYRVKVQKGMNCKNQHKVAIKFDEQHFILLKKSTKILKFSVKMLMEVQMALTLYIELMEEQTQVKEPLFLRVLCNSLTTSQFIVDKQNNKIDTNKHSFLNGTSVRGSFFLVNNNHQKCPFRIQELIEVDDYQSYCQKLEELSLKIEMTQGVIQARGSVEINYELTSSLIENDTSFVLRYSQLSIKDQTYVFKLRNSKHFKKNLTSLLRIQFGSNKFQTFTLKNRIVNPAIRFNRHQTQNACSCDTVNDTEFNIPFSIPYSSLYTQQSERSFLKPGMNVVEVVWKQSQGVASKENQERGGKCQIRMNVLSVQLVLYEPCQMLRPKSAYLKDNSSRLMLSREAIKEKIGARAPTKKGEVGVRQFREISAKDFTQQPSKYIKHQFLNEKQFIYLQINYNQKGYVLTNSHPTKNIMVSILEKGYLYLQSCNSYVLPYQKKLLKLEHNGKLLEIKSKGFEDSQAYKIKTKELLFCFSQNQKEYHVSRQVQITNKTDEILTVHCLSVDDEYFHSMETDHKIEILPKDTKTYSISFRPLSQKNVNNEKVTRNIQFLINDNKEIITCEGDFLHATIVSDVKNLTFNNCPYSYEETSQTFTLTNKGLNKVWYRIDSPLVIGVTPEWGILAEKGKVKVTISFRPSELTKKFYEYITIEFKGSHVMRIPLKVTTLEPNIFCQQKIVNFGSGFIKHNLESSINIVNQNNYCCQININCEDTELKTIKSLIVQPHQKQKVDLELMVKNVGMKVMKLPGNFLELKGYGAIPSPIEYKFIGKQTTLQLFPDNLFKTLTCSLCNEVNSFKIKNISDEVTPINIALQPKIKSDSVILSCEPSKTQIYPGQEKQFSLHSIRTCQDDSEKNAHNINYNIKIYLNHNQIYRSIDFLVIVPPPKLEITPNQIYFPLACVGVWSRASFLIKNRGYNQTFIGIKKPTNISFQFNAELKDNINRLTRLSNQIEVILFYKSKKSVSFSVILEVENNFGQKYQVKVNGTTSKSALLKCDQTLSSSSSLGSGKSSKSFGGFSSKSLSLLDNSSSDQVENFKFFSQLINGLFPDSIKKSQLYFVWLSKPSNLCQFLNFIKSTAPINCQGEVTLINLCEQLKKQGYPIHTIRCELLKVHDKNEWSCFLWFLLSKDMVNEDCLKWVNKVCAINLETYDNAFNHHKKVLIDLMSRLLQPIFKSKVSNLQKLTDLFQPAIPIISSIESKRQFVLLINFLYLKFSKVQTETIKNTNYIYKLKLPGGQGSKHRWILSNNPFSAQIYGNGNVEEERYLSDKRLYSISYTGEMTMAIKFQQDSCVGVWNSQCFQPIKFYNITLIKKSPIVQNITIECEDQCQQEWVLDFVCTVQSEYFYQFSGDNQFKCKTPQLGIIKAGSIMKFIISYGPTNLREHEGVLKVSNKFEEYVYNLKGKPLRTRKIEVQRTIMVQQGQRHSQTFGIAQTSNNTINNESYMVKELDSKTTEELKSCEAKSNGKEVIISLIMQYKKAIRNQPIFLQVTSKDGSFCRNVRLIVSVIPRPVMIRGELKGIVQKQVVQKIPLINALNIKQNCFISLYKISKQTYDGYNLEHINDENPKNGQKDQWQFKLSSVGRLTLMPNETKKLQLSFLSMTLKEICCQIRIKMEGTQQIIVYNFVGMSQLPRSDNKTVEINCEAEKETARTIRIPNKLREEVRFEVETNISFIAGLEEVILSPRGSHDYRYKLLPMHEGQYKGELIFKNERFCLVYPLYIKVTSNKTIKTIKVMSTVRESQTICLQLVNKSDKSIEYDVLCERDYLDFPSKLTIAPRSQSPLNIKYTPLFVGTKIVELKLYNEFVSEIIYLIEMTAQEYRRQLMFDCELGQPHKFSLNIKNTTEVMTQLESPILPSCINLQQANNIFPLTLKPGNNIQFDLTYTQQHMVQEQKCSLSFLTDLIGSFNFDCLFTIHITKKMPRIVVQYELDQSIKNIVKEWNLDFCNSFQETLQLKIKNRQLRIHNIQLRVESKEEVSVRPFQRKSIKCKAQIAQPHSQRTTRSQKHEDLIVIEGGQFRWIYPIVFTQLLTVPHPIEIIGSSHQLVRIRVTLSNMRSVKHWQVTDLPQYDKIVKTAYLSSNDLYIEAIVNKNFDYNGSITFFEEDMTYAEQYPLVFRIGGKIVKTVAIEANVGETGVVKLKIKNGRGKYHVEFKNNKKKEFKVSPLEGRFLENGQNVLVFEYAPIEYNGTKKAEASVFSEGGNFDFNLVGKFPSRKQ